MKKEPLRKKEKGLNRHWKNYKDTDYLSSANLESGEEMLLTIAKFEGEEMVQTTGGPKEPMLVLYFTEAVPKMILNVTNARTLEGLYGSHPDKWFGKQILIYSAELSVAGKSKTGLRIRDIIPKYDVDLVARVAEMNACQTKEQLKAVWEGFSKSTQHSPELIKLKEDLKSKLV